MNLYIYAHPARMITFQKVTEDNTVVSIENCSFGDVVRTTAKYKKDDNINKVYVIGDTVFADKISTMIKNNLKNIEVERIRNA